MNKLVFSLIIILFLIPCDSFSQVFHQDILRSTILIEKITDEGINPHGTGFFLYNYEHPNKLIVVTCAHIVGNNKSLVLRFNADSLLQSVFTKYKTNQFIDLENNFFIVGDQVRLIVDLQSNSQTKFVTHDSLDIAAFYVDFPLLYDSKDSISIKPFSPLSIPKSLYGLRENIKLGEEVYFIGFPFGMGTVNFVDPIVRSGSIAWKSHNSNEFLLDAFSFGGNSGSPIFYKISGDTKSSLSPKLVGMVIGHHGIRVENILSQPNPEVLKFEKGSIDLNVGLTRCLYLDHILDTVNKLKSQSEN